MRQRVVPSLAGPVGSLWRDLQEMYTKQGNFSVASPLSSTPLPVYDWIIENAHSFKNWEKMKFVLMDEMVEGHKELFTYVPLNDLASYEGFARKYLLKPLKEKVGVDEHVIKPDLASMQSFETPIDLLILALGVKGNYANVMPGTSETTGWHVAQLIREFHKFHTQQGSASYEGANFREFGMSLGPQQVLQAKNIAVIIGGKQKRDVTKQLLSYSSFDPEFPLSIIYHPNVQDRVEIFIKEDAFS